VHLAPAFASSEGALMKTARRFLLASSLARLITRDRAVDGHIVEGYLSVKPGNHQFVSITADECHLVLPLLGPGGELTEDRASLPRAHADALIKLSVGQISYDRRWLPTESVSSHKVVLDRIVSPGSCDVVTVEFDDVPQAEAFEVPLWFGPEVTTEYSYERRHIALNGVPSHPEVPLTDLQLEAALDLLDQWNDAAEADRRSAAHEVIDALSRSLETSDVLKSSDETTAPSGGKPEVEKSEQPMRRSA
jgi:CYTH domain-containing protein